MTDWPVADEAASRDLSRFWDSKHLSHELRRLPSAYKIHAQFVSGRAYVRRQLAGLTSAIVLMWLFLSVGCRTGGNAGLPGQPNAEDGARLKQATAEWDRLFNNGQAADLAALYSQDLMSMPYDAPTVSGRPAQQAAFEEFFAENENARHETTVEETLVTNEWAIERGRYKMTYTPRKTGIQIVETGRHVMCRRKADGNWQIVWEIWNTDKPLQ
jgi:ketosteroid isomerase-like protein